MLEVHEEESPGEPMKTGTELLKELRAQSDKDEATETAYHQARSDGYTGAADLLKAWLGEADEYLRVEQKLCEKVEMQLSDGGKYNNRHYGGRAFSCGRFREVLLGTTQEGKK